MTIELPITKRQIALQFNSEPRTFNWLKSLCLELVIFILKSKWQQVTNLLQIWKFPAEHQRNLGKKCLKIISNFLTLNRKKVKLEGIEYSNKRLKTVQN